MDMKTEIYLHHGKYLCAIVSSKEGHKFVDNIEKHCPNWHTLIDLGKTGFDGFPFYDRYQNHDIAFLDQYLDIIEGIDENYTYLGYIEDGAICFYSEYLKDKGEYFEPLFTAMKLSEIYDFNRVNDIVFTKDYIVLSSNCEVMAFSKIKIPFEPNSEQAAFRDLIRSKLKLLQPFGNQLLYAQYGCSFSQFTDIENALFYNIGTTFFSAALGRKTTVYFQRIQPNEICQIEGWGFQYLYRYARVLKGNQKHWWEHNLICEWNNIPLAKVNSTSNATDYYLSLKHSPELISCFEDGSDSALGLKIRLFVPRTSNLANVVSIMKPMIDGVICAFHTPDKIAVDEVSKLLNINKEVISSTEKTCLGKCCYVSPYRKSVKWNPQDERLDYVVLEPVVVDEDVFSFSGQIFAIPCYM